MTVSACSVKPPDVPACEALEPYLGRDPVNGHLILKPSPTCMKQVGEAECGHCVYIVSGKELFIGEGALHLLNKKKWSELRKQAVLLPAEESYAPLAAFMINACKKMHCSDDITRFKVKLDSLNAIKDVKLEGSP